MDRKDYILKIYNLARLGGLCNTQGEFAELLGVQRTGISAALNGSERHLTQSLENRVRLFAQAHNLEGDAHAQAEPAAPQQQQGVFIPEGCRQMFENMTETIKLQAKLLDRLQGGDIHSSAVSVLPSPKNFSHK